MAENGAVFTVDCAYVSGTLGTGSFANSEDVIITFARTGDSGDEGSQGTQGIQGIQGIQGDLGLQGETGAGTPGSQGPQGIQGNQGTAGIGTQGIQGIQGIQGREGFQGEGGFQGEAGAGTQGTQGIQGDQGIQGEGIQGPSGAYYGIRFEYDTSTTAGAGVGQFRTNNNTLQASTTLYFSKQMYDGSGFVDSYLLSWGTSSSTVKGHLIVKGTDDNATWDAGEFYVFPVTAVADQSTYIEVTVNAAIDFGSQGFTDADVCYVEFYKSGDGTIGAQGVQGFQGFDGQAGAPGAQGIQGVQGDQGVQGPQGFSGTACTWATRYPRYPRDSG